ncbi:hypothetical protein LGL08_20610 [Clostridium estertheticum]|uniref:hypothetical protein n=1 Tax=Clostridium estertheticum TaxID=238834 RepID=UPI001CF34FA3|nr:hypothetical protein [Clostridium estertheticum]MCB2308889.1 hypothetical protein [Clostridium estertheticum]MCB2347301.1 hypothetical protein [Clostridium estertheticum]MCB2351932.1 hypothetical protein [Clostridium estertheticum]WAG48502.1 hypothetical protein LL127_23190 [Clostridium estertheticum]
MGYTIADHEASMTIFYSKSTGEIKGACSGIQDFKMYGIDAEDYSLIWAFIVIKNDDNVLQNPNNFKMDLSGAEPILSIRQEAVNQYPIASA